MTGKKISDEKDKNRNEDKKISKRELKITRILYIFSTIFCLVFGMIYEHFSHNVYSNYMIYAFAVPFIGGIVNEILFRMNYRKGVKNSASAQLWGGAVTWVTLGSIFKGVLEIYGTTNKLVDMFFVIGLVQVIAAILIQIFDQIVLGRTALSDK